jgi:hypothetical protein
MSENKRSNQKTGPQKLASVLDFVVRFAGPIQIFAFIALAAVLRRWLAAPAGDAIAALLVVLPSYWLIPQPRIGPAAYAAFCIVLAICLAVIEYLLFP